MKSSYTLYALAILGSAFAQSDSGSTPSATSQAGSATVAGSTTSSSGTAKPSGTAAAQSNNSSQAAPASADVPSGISSSCQTFLDTLDSDPQFASCTQPLLAATDAFAPTSSTTNVTTQTLVSTLGTLCSTTGCPTSYVRTQLVDFYTACQPELSGQNPNAAVQDTYDIMYIMVPLQQALCTKDTDGTYCALKAPSTSTSTSANSTSTTGLPNVANNYVTGGAPGSDADITNGNIASFRADGLVTTTPSGLTRRATSDDQTVVQYAPNTQVYRDTGVAYLFTTGTLSAASLCTHCTQAILTVYAAWESSTSYGRGLSKSPMLGGQAQLWQSVSQKCGAAFVSQIQGSVGPVVPGRAAGALGTNGATASFNLQSGFLTFALVAFGAMFAL